MYASIDIGTNTVLLLVAVLKEGKLNVLHEEQRMPRLGKGVDASGNLHSESEDRVMTALREFRKLLEYRFPEVTDVIVTATSAVRDAANRQPFIRRVKEETGFEVRLLEGFEEADYTYAGALSVLPTIPQAAVIDIGGGSTEIAYGKNGELLDSHSFDMGSVRFSERYLKSDPPSAGELEECTEATKKMFVERPFTFDGDAEGPELVGVAGTVTSLAFLDADLDAYNPEALNGYRMSVAEITGWIQRLSSMTAGEIEAEYPPVMQGRADVIIGGLLILKGFMEHYSIPELTVSTGGIRHGAIIKKAIR